MASSSLRRQPIVAMPDHVGVEVKSLRLGDVAAPPAPRAWRARRAGASGPSGCGLRGPGWTAASPSAWRARTPSTTSTRTGPASTVAESRLPLGVDLLDELPVDLATAERRRSAPAGQDRRADPVDTRSGRSAGSGAPCGPRPGRGRTPRGRVRAASPTAACRRRPPASAGRATTSACSRDPAHHLGVPPALPVTGSGSALDADQPAVGAELGDRRRTVWLGHSHRPTSSRRDRVSPVGATSVDQGCQRGLGVGLGCLRPCATTRRRGSSGVRGELDVDPPHAVANA